MLTTESVNKGVKSVLTGCQQC